MTLEELRALVTDLRAKTDVVYETANELRSLIIKVDSLISPNNPYAETVDVDQLVTIYTPLYLAALTDVETACDALGTDVLH